MKVVENSYRTFEETLNAIYRLVREEKRSLNDIVVVTNSENRKRVLNSSPVEVDAVPGETHRSIWDSIQSLFQDDGKQVLADYGVDDTTARQYQDAIEYGNFVVLVEHQPGDDGYEEFNPEENKSRLSDAELQARQEKTYDRGLDLRDPDERSSFGRTPPQQ